VANSVNVSAFDVGDEQLDQSVDRFDRLYGALRSASLDSTEKSPKSQKWDSIDAPSKELKVDSFDAPSKQFGVDDVDAKEKESLDSKFLPKVTEDGLAIARLVFEEEEDLHIEHLGLARAEEFNDDIEQRIEEKKAYKRKMFCRRLWVYGCCSFCCLVGIPVAIFAGYLASQQIEIHASRTADTVQQLSLRQEFEQDILSAQDYVLTLMPDYSLPMIDLVNLESPTYQTAAFLWVVNDPYLKDYKGWRIIQRYALAALYVSTRKDVYLLALAFD